jgi:hypothetical protein
VKESAETVFLPSLAGFEIEKNWSVGQESQDN